MTDRITVQLLEDPDDPDQVLLDLGLELCDQLGWKPGDSLEWQPSGDGAWILYKPSQP